MKSKEIVLSKKKAIIFGIVIDILVTTIISYGGYDAVNAFYGEEGYVEDGSNGQVMVYQPKFYYQRLPMKVENTNNGIVIRRERLFISDNAQSGFKLHPLFIDTNGNELDYVLIPAYEGSVANNKLQSIAGVQPAAYFNPISGETAASARGTGWHMTTAQFESASQILQMVEYGTMNAQAANEKGICTGLSPARCRIYIPRKKRE